MGCSWLTTAMPVVPVVPPVTLPELPAAPLAAPLVGRIDAPAADDTVQIGEAPILGQQQKARGHGLGIDRPVQAGGRIRLVGFAAEPEGEAPGDGAVALYWHDRHSS